VDVPLVAEELDVDFRVVVVVLCGAVAVELFVRIAGVVAVPAFICSAAVTESSGVPACAARPRSLLSEGSAALSLLHAADNAIAGARTSILSAECM
jgi:hypothetical protein